MVDISFTSSVIALDENQVHNPTKRQRLKGNLKNYPALWFLQETHFEFGDIGWKKHDGKSYIITVTKRAKCNNNIRQNRRMFLLETKDILYGKKFNPWEKHKHGKLVSKSRAPKYMKQKGQNWKTKIVICKRSTKLAKTLAKLTRKKWGSNNWRLKCTLLIMDITNRWKMNKEIEDLYYL